MSHVQTIKTELKNKSAVQAACARLGLTLLDRAKHELYGGQSAEGFAVQLPDWRYPVVINTDSGEVRYDNYNGSWGKQVTLDKLIQAYQIENLTAEAMMRGFVTNEEVMADGTVKLVCTASD